MKTSYLIVVSVLLAALTAVAKCQLGNVVLRAVTIDQKPYIFIDRTKTGNARYSGFAIDLFDEVLKIVNLNITYQIYEVPDGKFGSFTNGTWNGMVAQLNQTKADVALGPLTATFERLQAIDETIAYLSEGYVVAVLKPTPQPDLFAFVSPFSWEVWLLIVVADIVIAVYTWLIARLSPYGSYKQGGETKHEFNFNAALLNTITTSIAQDGTVGRSWSTRVVLLCFLFFNVIIAATYTANLAAVLTTQRQTPTVTSLSDIATYSYPFACVTGSAIANFFISNPNGITYRSYMVLYNTYEEGLEALRRGDVKAFVWDKSILEYTVNQQPCDTIVVGGIFNNILYGFPLQLNSPYNKVFSNAILRLRESGTVDTLYKKWWFQSSACTADSTSNTGAITIRNAGGVFLLLLIGMGVGAILLMFELLYSFLYKKKLSKFRQFTKHVDSFIGKTVTEEQPDASEMLEDIYKTMQQLRAKLLPQEPQKTPGGETELPTIKSP